MSKIAEALAKAKERTGTTTAPFLVGKPVLAPAAMSAAKEAAIRKAQRTQRFWIVLTSLVGLVTAAIIWQRLTPDKPAPAAPVVAKPAPPPPPPAEPAVPEPPPLVLPPPKTTLPPAAGETAAGTDAASAKPVVPPNADLYKTVNALVISAVLPGDQPRLMHKGRIIYVGDRVDAELVFAGLQDGQIVFNDKRGAIYVRRY